MPLIRASLGSKPAGQIKQSLHLDKAQDSGYIIARMRHEIILSPEAVEDLKQLGAHQRAKVKDLIEVHLSHDPTKTSKSRIKRLSGLRHPQYRLRIDDIRVFYDVEENSVEILAIISKPNATEWLKKAGEKA
jgi:mRNA-degrading endonuclease RelE of RelBE toxin-antitoxin system